jgi:hypothetical protein
MSLIPFAPFTNGGGTTFDRARADVARGKDSRETGFERAGWVRAEKLQKVRTDPHLLYQLAL